MDRVIKFRWKCVNGGEWIESMTISLGTIKRKENCVFFEIAEDNWKGVIPETVGQLIGIIPNTSMYVDNQQELYEGDLFTCGNSKTVYQAVYDGCGEYYGISNEGDKYGPYTVRRSRSNIKSQNIKVIGNIHDNPELLEGGKE